MLFLGGNINNWISATNYLCYQYSFSWEKCTFV